MSVVPRLTHVYIFPVSSAVPVSLQSIKEISGRLAEFLEPELKKSRPLDEKEYGSLVFCEVKGGHCIFRCEMHAAAGQPNRKSLVNKPHPKGSTSGCCVLL
jgi:hypothetical protein